MTNAHVGWDEARTEMVRKLWAEGLSASHIANRLGGVTRNGVIGKVHRMGLARRATTTRLSNIRRKKWEIERDKRKRRAEIAVKLAKAGKPKSALLMLKAEPLPVFEEISIPEGQRKTLLQLDDRGCDCRWGIGDPQSADFHFCNRAAVPGLPYCEFHSKRAFRAPEPATRREFVTLQRMGATV